VTTLEEGMRQALKSLLPPKREDEIRDLLIRLLILIEPADLDRLWKHLMQSKLKGN
jgi:hypothetical protein